MFSENLVACIKAAVPAVALTTSEWDRVIADVDVVAKAMKLIILMAILQ